MKVRAAIFLEPLPGVVSPNTVTELTAGADLYLELGPLGLLAETADGSVRCLYPSAQLARVEFEPQTDCVLPDGVISRGGDVPRPLLPRAPRQRRETRGAT